MAPSNKPVFIATLLAYRILAAPTGHDQQDQVPSVINALKDQIKVLNLSWKPSIVDDVESALQACGLLDAKVITSLDQKIERRVITAEGYDADWVAAHTIECLISKGALVEPGEQVVEDKALYLTADMIYEVLDDVLEQERDAVKRDCPHKGKLCGGCVIL